ncbi:ArnT family glycosyltransferase [Massilia sp. TWP1-3-3]|uniref:ArnT family glycosyltransferase n=1 Tax=Massilia sp. TWP1-3-3 TaxID=2804573 RepID=UPI003CEBB758
MKPVRLAAAATLALPRWALFGLGLLYILPGLIGRDLWKDDAGSFGIMWTMAQGNLHDWFAPNIAGLPVDSEGPLAFWLGALCIKLFGWLLGDIMAARVSTMGIFVVGAMSVWYTAFHLGRRPEAQPLRLAFGGQPEPNDYGRTLADTAALIYLGCLGLLLFSHETLAVTLQGTLVAYFLYRAVRYVEAPSLRNIALIGLSLGLLTLARGWQTPVTLALALLLCSRFLDMPLPRTLAHLGLAVLTALLIALLWIFPAVVLIPGDAVNPVQGWMLWSASQVGFPTWASIATFLRVGIWFFWPAWPFAAWAIYAWRRQDNLLHIVLPLTFLATLTVLIVLDPVPQNGDLLKLLPPLAIMAAFGMPTMKRGTINAIDWFSVMVLTMLAGMLWMFWIAQLSGMPAWAARNAAKLLPGFVPEFSAVPFIVAACASVGWIALVLWRISRQPAVLWRAVVLSSGGLILLWVLLMTLFLPDLNYSKSYATVARQLAANLPAGDKCVDGHVGLPQRASFAYYGAVPFAPVGEKQGCSLLLVQDSVKLRDDKERAPVHDPAQWQQIWEGRRASDRDERFKLYQRK